VDPIYKLYLGYDEEDPMYADDYLQQQILGAINTALCACDSHDQGHRKPAPCSAVWRTVLVGVRDNGIAGDLVNVLNTLADLAYHQGQDYFFSGVNDDMTIGTPGSSILIS
jgi:hypothetical protein